MNLSPLGACAMAGTTLPIDRQMTAEALGFAAPTENAMDSVSDRDYMLEFMSAASISMMHISRWAEEYVWWNSSEFSYISIDDSFCTGSSIMPQKKNPDMAELLRGKVGRVYGDLLQLLTVMKGTPMAYNKDFQEDKEHLFDAVDTWKASLAIFTKMIQKTEFRLDKIEEQLSQGFLNATDVAEHLAKQGIPFRDAHHLVGRMVMACDEKTAAGQGGAAGGENKTGAAQGEVAGGKEKTACGNDKMGGGQGKVYELEDLTDEDLRAIDERLSLELVGDISVKTCVDARASFGGTAPAEVLRQSGVGKAWLAGFAR